MRAKNDVYVSAVKNFFGADFMSYRLFFFQEIEQFQSNRRFSEIDIYFGKLIEKVIGGAKKSGWKWTIYKMPEKNSEILAEPKR